jgi:acyl dehydratase
LSRLSFAAPPSLGAAYLRALIDRRPRRLPPGSGASALDAELGGATARPANLAAYRAACDLPDDGRLPLTYPHIMAGGLHMHMLLHPAFPVRVLGLVHLANDIELLRPLPEDATLAFACRLQTGRSKPRGDEFQLVTEALCQGELAWRETMRFLAPAPRDGRRSPRETPELPGAVAEWSVPADTGRRYARASGDWNPIHLAGFLARPFGFPAAIAHGMWSLASCLAHLATGSPGAGARLEVRFLKPLLLPGKVRLHVAAPEDSGACGFWLVSARDAAPHLKGSWYPGSN